MELKMSPVKAYDDNIDGTVYILRSSDSAIDPSKYKPFYAPSAAPCNNKLL